MRTIGTLLLMLGIVVTALRTDPVAGQEKAKPLKGKITVGRETTYVTGPLDKDGYVDYIAALNERLRQGVTPESNANVLLWKAFGPHPERATMPAEFFRRLGIRPPPDKGPYFTDLFRYVAENTKIDVNLAAGLLGDQLGEIGQRPWKEKEFPLMAEWLTANEQPLAVIDAATRLKHFYSPLVPSGADKDTLGLTGVLLPAVQQCRSLAAALTGRATLRAGRGDHDGAWQDLLTCHRLGRHVAQGGTLIEYLVGVAIDHIVSRADLVFLASTRPDARRAEGYLSDLEKLPPFPALADKVDLTERLMFLENVIRLDRHGIRDLNGLLGVQAEDPELRVEFRAGAIDWDPALRVGNRWYDRLAAALRDKDRGKREKELNRIEADLKALRTELVDSGKAARLLNEDQPAPARGKVLGEVLLTMRMPWCARCSTAADRIRQVHDNLLLGFALEVYRREHGRYPESLDALAPRYLKEIPGDLFSGKALIYRPAADGYLLYSVGINGKDEGGRGYDDDPPGDDLSVRMPPPELRRGG